MRVRLAFAAVMAAAILPQAASAATIVIFTDPMSLDRRTVVLDTPGRDRLVICQAPPALTGCREMPFVRARR